MEEDCNFSLLNSSYRSCKLTSTLHMQTALSLFDYFSLCADCGLEVSSEVKRFRCLGYKTGLALHHRASIYS